MLLHFRVSNTHEVRDFTHARGPIEFGRVPSSDGHPRCVIQDRFVSKDHVRIEQTEAGKVWLQNLSQRNRIRIDAATEIGVAAGQLIVLPMRFVVGETVIEISEISETDARGLPTTPDAPASPPAVSSISTPAAGSMAPAGEILGEPEYVGSLATIARPMRIKLDGRESRPTLVSMRDTLTTEGLIPWIETMISVQKAAVGSTEFFQETAKALVELIGLDRGLVIVNRGGQWQVMARFGASVRYGSEFSRSILEKVASEKRTFFESFENMSPTTSLANLDAVVASPVFDANENTVGVLYGSRTRRGPEGASPIGPVEAQIVQLLAASVSTGFARARHQEDLLRVRMHYERFFSPELAEQLERDPNLLDGQQREVTVLFLDLRGSSRLSQMLTPHDVYRITEDYMEEVTESVSQTGGIVVDYAGDGVLALWNAPTDQPDHAARACRTALATLEALPRINDRWQSLIKTPIAYGVGLNSGLALVGNTGSRSNLKYGPQGPTVNLGSRVEGATKYLGVPVLITQSTRDRIGDEFVVRRLCSVKVVGMEGAVALFELHGTTAEPEWLEIRDVYERALECFENARFEDAVDTLYRLIVSPAGKHDKPTLALLTRSLEYMKTPPENFEPIFELSSK